MSSVLSSLPSISLFNKSTRGCSDFTQDAVCQEEAFRYLLEAEHKRAERSGHRYYILFAYRTDEQGMVVRMNTYIANEVFDALARSLRETDYIGWYREGHIAGGVLTVVGPDSVGDVHQRVQRRLKEINQSYADKKGGSFQIRLCRQHELQAIDLFAEKAVAIQ